MPGRSAMMYRSLPASLRIVEEKLEQIRSRAKNRNVEEKLDKIRSSAKNRDLRQENRLDSD